ncbi:DEAD/DEAH box helicase [Candidatus Saccharibacteria bacterium]|nr:DEAD/DEAH box helicase [Candidatus Saccharibacteria bacterium]
MKIKYDSRQPFQIKAINAIADVFEGQPADVEMFSTALKTQAIRGTQTGLFNEIGAVGNNLVLDEDSILENVRAIQNDNGIEPAKRLDGMNFSVEMETGTGKTYVYLRTALELSKRYGFNKFIIIVPSIAIKEGVKSSIEAMRDHFRFEAGYDPYEAMVYDGKSPEVVQSFATSTMTQFMIMTIDAIRGNRKLIIREQRDKLNGIAPIDYLSAVNPIVIMDEPQNMESELSTSAIADLNPMATLRYSATHTRDYNMMYRLDPVDAHREKLVKGIVVANAQQKGSDAKPYIKLLDVRNSPRLEAHVELLVRDRNGNIGRKPLWVKHHDKLDIRTGNSIYEGYTINEISTIPANVEIGTHGVLMLGDNWGGNEDQILREMIRETVKEHIKREYLLRGEGIKVLSLFFVDRVASYLAYDDEGNAVDGRFVKWFDELYREERAKYASYLELPEEPNEVRAAYFAEMRKGGKTSLVDSKEGKGNANDESAYDLIMKGKEKLLDQSNPVRFIFSHSALKEGWDNPNVFQICMMRESSSENDRRQTIGRGLRLPVRQDGTRVFDEQINQLTVIANESYRDFASNLQKEYKKAGIQIGYVRKGEFARITLHDEPDKTLGHAASGEIWAHLQRRGYIDDDGKVLANFTPQNTGFNLDLPGELQQYHSEVVDIIESCKIDKFVKDARNKQKIRLNKEVMYSPELETLWKKISRKTTYRVSFDNGQVTMASIETIKRAPEIKALRVEVVKNKVKLLRGGIHNAGIVGESATNLAGTFELPDIISELQDETGLTRRTIVDILQGSNRLHEFLKNPYDYIQLVKNSIKSVLASVVIDGIQYEKIAEEVYELREFQRDSEEEVERFIDRLYEVKNTQKTITDKLALDSSTESEFANYLDNREDIKLFLKLPARFVIPTPVGPYNPDWAIVKEVDGNEKVYMVRETKNGGERESELQKIHCATEHFKEIGMYDYAKSTPEDWRV